MYIEKLYLPDYPDRIIKYTKGNIVTKKDMHALKVLGIEKVDINILKGICVENTIERCGGSPSNGNHQFSVSVQSNPVKTVEKAQSPKKELNVAKEMYNDLINFSKDISSIDKTNFKFKYESSIPIAKKIVNNVTENPDALVTLTSLRSYDEYTFTHCINVAILAVAFGKYLGLSKEKLLSLGVGSLFHDIGKSRIPDRILNKSGRLTEGEFEIIKRHPQEGYDIAKSIHSLPHDIVTIILEHHEKYNGRGYPRGLFHGDINQLANIVSVADVYDALTSDRVYKEAMPPNDALSIVYEGQGEDFYPGLSELFVKCIGIYPVGSLVLLSSGYTAIVIGSNSEKPLEPTVQLVHDHMGRSCIPEIIDLSSPQYSLNKKIKIKKCLDMKTLGIDVQKYLFDSSED